MTAAEAKRVNEYGHECWIVETSKDGDRWRFFGKAWKQPDQQILLHAVPKFVRFRPDGDDGWSEPLERSSDEPMTLLDLEAGVRTDLWPGEEHLGLPMLLPGGESGRLLRFEHRLDPEQWTYALEFTGAR
ncbi:MAG: hypothetical protein QOE25_1495 [Actinomycetota bacterium]|jgi:hypothetical protein|nr:hypothetical protein [Actinomycetota bacterium]